jgi:exoribonuclease R
VPLPCVGCDAADRLLADGLARIRAELDVPSGFPAAAEAAAAGAVPSPPIDAPERDDRRDLPLVTLDPLGSRDLDQAFAIEPLDEGGWRVWYAIADVAAFVPSGGPVDAEARARGVTLYLPDGRAPLHPPVLSEGSASLLPGEDRPALLWRLEVDASGVLTSGRVRRSLVRSRAQLDYPSAQLAVDGGALADDDPLVRLRGAGETLLAAEGARGGVSLPLPEQVVLRADGGAEPGGEAGDVADYELAWRVPLAVEQWNAQLSLLCGRAAANLMLQGGVGLLRTLPPFDERAVETVRRRARALGVAWPSGPVAAAYPAFVRSLDPASSIGAALLNVAARALRGAGYVAFGPGVGAPPTGGEAVHSAVAAHYAHVTAPLRRLGDRFAADAALAIATHVDVPDWVLEGLSAMPGLLTKANQREGDVSRAVVDLAEAAVLSSRLGRELDAVVVGVDERGSALQVLDPPVRARTSVPLDLGAAVRVRVAAADPLARTVDLVPV